MTTMMSLLRRNSGPKWGVGECLKEEAAACALDEFLMDAFYRLSVSASACAICHRCGAAVSLRPLGFGTGMASIYRRLCVCVWVGKGRGGVREQRAGVMMGMEFPRAGNGQLEASLPPLNTSFQTKSLQKTSSRPLRTFPLWSLCSITHTRGREANWCREHTEPSQSHPIIKTKTCSDHGSETKTITDT